MKSGVNESADKNKSLFEALDGLIGSGGYRSLGMGALLVRGTFQDVDGRNRQVGQGRAIKLMVDDVDILIADEDGQITVP
jgi:hypothetical protein